MIQISVGTNSNPGPIYVIEDSLTLLEEQVRSQFKLGFSIVVAEIPGMKLVFDNVPESEPLKLYPRQR